MKFTKKFISVLLAVVLVLGSFSVCAFAWTGDGTQEAKITIVPDKTTVSAGETVNFDIVLNLAEGGSWSTFGNFLFSFMYDSSVLTPVSKTYGETVANFSSDRALGIVTAAATITNVKNKSTTDEQALFTTNNYNAMCRLQCMKDANSLYGADGYWTASDGELLATITCTVAEGVADGTPVAFDYVSGLSSLGYFYLQTIDTNNSNKGTIQKSATLYDCTDCVASETTVVGTAAKEYETSIVSFWKDQIKMDNSEYTSFSIRHLAQIEASVWESTFGTDEDKDATGTKNITDIGFIFQKGDGFDKDAAANWLEAGATDDSFTKASVNFVSTGMKDGYYVFSCTITNMSDPDAALSSLGYVVWVDDANTTHYSYFEDVETETFRDLYDRYVAAH